QGGGASTVEQVAQEEARVRAGEDIERRLVRPFGVRELKSVCLVGRHAREVHADVHQDRAIAQRHVRESLEVVKRRKLLETGGIRKQLAPGGIRRNGDQHGLSCADIASADMDSGRLVPSLDIGRRVRGPHYSRRGTGTQGSRDVPWRGQPDISVEIVDVVRDILGSHVTEQLVVLVFRNGKTSQLNRLCLSVRKLVLAALRLNACKPGLSCVQERRLVWIEMLDFGLDSLC